MPCYCGKTCAVDPQTGHTHPYCGKYCASNDPNKQKTSPAQLCAQCHAVPCWFDPKAQKYSQTCSRRCQSLLHPPSPVPAPRPPSTTTTTTTTCSILSPSDAKYTDIQGQFNSKWLHTNKGKRTIVAIVRIHMPAAIQQAFDAYQNSLKHIKIPTKKKHTTGAGNTRLRFHGTRQTCLLGLKGTQLCHDSKCSVCCIARTSWKLSFTTSTSSTSRFGEGLYFTATSSKADDYSDMALKKQGIVSNLLNSGYKSMFVAKVVCGKVHKASNDMPHLKAAPQGCHSVCGDKQNTTTLNYDEIVVYKEEAAIPRYIIIYK